MGEGEGERGEMVARNGFVEIEMDEEGLGDLSEV